MTLEVIIFLGILAVAFCLFVFEIFPVDVTALGLLVVLLVTGYLDVSEAVSGFSNKAMLTVAAMFVLSRAFVKTGLPAFLVDRLSKITENNKGFGIFAFLLFASLTSMFINNTAVVAIFLPLALRLCQRLQISPSKILIPLSYGAIYGGALTLIGTSTNLLVSSLIEEQGLPHLRMFEFTLMGLIFLVVGTIYNQLWVQKVLAPRAVVSSLSRKYHLAPYLTELKISDVSPLVDFTCVEGKISEKYDITVLAIIRGKERFDTNIRNIKLKPGDILLVRGTIESFLQFRDNEKVLLLTDVKMDQKELTGGESILVEGLIPQGSALIGKTLKEVDFRKKFGAFVLAIRHEGKTLRKKIANIVLSFADTLLIFVPKSRLSILEQSADVAILLQHDIQLHKVRFWWLAIAIIPLIMIFSAIGVVDILEASLIGVLVLLMLRSMTIQESYSAVDWSVLMTIATFVPVGLVMEKTGTATLIGNAIVQTVDYFPPHFASYTALAIIYFVTMVLTAVMSNNSTAIAMIPVALAVASQMGLETRPFIFAVCFAASMEFATPIGYQTHLMVYGPGGYRFIDYMKAGALLDLIFFILACIFIPVFWPF